MVLLVLLLVLLVWQRVLVLVLDLVVCCGFNAMHNLAQKQRL